MRVAVEAGSSVAFSSPTKLLEGRYYAGTEGRVDAPGRTYDISPDGRGFLMIKESGSATDSSTPPTLIVVQHFDEELKRLVPTK